MVEKEDSKAKTHEKTSWHRLALVRDSGQIGIPRYMTNASTRSEVNSIP